VLVKKIISVLLLVALLFGGLISGGCARRSALDKKTRWYKRHHKEGGRIPCPTHDC
jgi:hypothetical protein